MRELLVADDMAVECDDVYYVVAPRKRFERQPARLFFSWLMQEVSAQMAS